MRTAYFLLLSTCFLTPLRAAAADELLFFPATVENTTLADGTALKVVAGKPDKPGDITRGPGDPEPDNHWHWQEGVGSGAGPKRGVFTAAGQPANDAPMLRTIVGGLKPLTDYQVFGFFWIAGFDTDAAEPAGDKQWDIRLGCGKAKMMGYGHRDNAGLPGTIGRRDNGEGVVRQMDAPLRPAAASLLDRDGDRRLFRAPLGIERTDANGTLVVYADDQPGDTNQGRTCYDGIGVMPATAKADVGSGSPGALHLAVRCGDWEMVRRELAAGAEINRLDHDGLTPLFYLAADLTTDRVTERVAAFLKAGAKPDVDGQTLSPLWAAATAGDVNLTKMLLDAGAKVPAGRLPDSPPRDTLKSASESHPAVAAIYSGSLKVLKLLLEREPKLDLDKLYANVWPEPYAVRDAVTHNHAEMAEFLIERGCQIAGKEAQRVPRYASPGKQDANKTGTRTLLIAAIMAQPPMRGVVAALARRGVTMVDTQPLLESGFVIPWDALSAAALAGDAELTARLLPAAGNVDAKYRARLLVLAQTGGNEKVIALVHQQFGDIVTPRSTEILSNNPNDRMAAAARVFKPRSSPPKPRAVNQGKRVMAVISSPEAAGPAAAIAAKASTANSWIVVEREQIETILRERDLAKPWEDRIQNLGSLGDRLSADLLIIVSQLKSGNLALLRLEAVDVHTGLLIDRQHLDAKKFKPDEFCDNYLPEVRRKLDDHLAGGSLTAVTLLPISVDGHLTSLGTLEGLLQAGLLQEIDNSPGMIALTREQMQPMVEEKTFQQPSALWGAAWTVEGGLKQLANGQVELALRVTSLGNDAASHDVKATGNATDVQTLVRSAWQQILTAIRGADTGAQTATAVAPPQQRATAEAARLLREAEWLGNIQRWHEAAPLVEAALYLGADPVKTVLLRMRIRMMMRHWWVGGRSYSTNAMDTQPIPEFPVTPEDADHTAQHLDEYLELLRLNSESLDRIGKTLLTPGKAADPKRPFDYFWRNLDTFIFYRSILQPQRMRPQELVTLKAFDQELESHLVRMFALIGPDASGRATLGRCHDYAWQHFRAVPSLGKALAEAIIRARYDGTVFHAFLEYPSDFEYRISGAMNGASHENIMGLGPNRLAPMCDHLAKVVADKDIPLRELRQAEIAFLRSSGEQRAAAARRLLQTHIATAAHLRTPYTDWVPLQFLSRWIPMLTDNIRGNYIIPSHGEAFIPGLVQSPEPVPDMSVRHRIYSGFGHSWLSAVQNGRDNDSMLRNAVSFLDTRVDEAAANRLPASTWDDILSSVRLLDKTFGCALAPETEARIAKLRPRTDAGTFGSKGQFPIISFAGALDPKLLADVRGDATDHPAMITCWMTDPRDHHILWLALQPYQEWDFKLAEPRLTPEQRARWYSNVPPIMVLRPWLVAIDCRDGHTVHRINLGAIPGLWPKGSPETMPMGEMGQAFSIGMFTNDTHLLVQISWGNLVYYPKPEQPDKALISVNRETGVIDKLPLNLLILNDTMVETRGISQFGVAGIGDSFFIRESFKVPLNGAREYFGCRLWQFKPGAAPQLLTQSGRRPEESPFDADDQTIRILRADKGRLLVASSWNHFAYYDPAQSKWQDAPARTEREWRNYVYGMDNNVYRANLRPYNAFKDPSGGKDTYRFRYEDDASTSGRLSFQIGGGFLADLPVSLKVPESYRARFQFNSDPTPNRDPLPDDHYEWITMADMARSNRVVPMILNQTDEHLVLAMRLTRTGTTMHFDAASPPCMPFLWILDKKEAAAAMKKIQAK